MEELDGLRSEFYNATTLTEDILNRFTISDSMDLQDYDEWNENLKLVRDPPGIIAHRLGTTATGTPRLGLRRGWLQSPTMRSAAYCTRIS